jgi:hypothetical protein
MKNPRQLDRGASAVVAQIVQDGNVAGAGRQPDGSAGGRSCRPPCYTPGRHAIDAARLTDMAEAALTSQTAFKYEAEVKEDGRIELRVPLPTGARIVVFVIRESGETFSDLVSASQSSLDFWDNPLDDADWNDA